MEAITFFNTPPQPHRRSLSFKLFPIRLIAFMLAMTLTILIMCASKVAHYITRPTSPFVSFADIFPGKPVDAISARGFFCTMLPYTTQAPNPEEYCVLSLKSGSIAQISVNVVKHTIHQTQFTLRNNLLRLADLMLCLGMPKNYQNGHIIDFDGHITNYVWPDSGIFASANSDSRRFFLLMPLSRISFTESGSSGLESLAPCLGMPMNSQPQPSLAVFSAYNE